MRKKRKKSHTPRMNNKSVNAHLQALVQQHSVGIAMTNSNVLGNNHDLPMAIAIGQWREAILFQGIDQVISKRPELDMSNYKNLPCIDLRGICKRSSTKNDDSISENVHTEWNLSDTDFERLSKWADSHYWLSMVPCFSEGVYRMSDTSYVHWSLDHMDIERNLIQVKVDYFGTELFDKPFLQVHIESNIIFGSDKEGVMILINEKKTATLYDMIKSLNPYSVKQWNAADVSQWKSIGQDFLHKWKLAETMGKLVIDNERYCKMTENLLIYTSIANAAMADANYDAKEMPASRISEDTAISSRPDKYQPTIKTFKVGHIHVSSFTGSPEPIEWTNVEYRTPSWMIRGHIRHLKSGKTCFVHSHEKHRRKAPIDDCPVPAASPNIYITGGDNP